MIVGDADRISSRLNKKITHHIPKSIRNREKPTKVLPRQNCKAKTPLIQLECDSTIGLHLLDYLDCAAHYHDQQFSIMAKAKTQFHLAALDTIFINFVPAERIRLLSSNFTIINH